MCGMLVVAGASCPHEVTKALELIAHRGPDDSGVFADNAVTLGHQRLSIIDPAGGHQPFHSRDGRYVIVFVGEIYNYRDLARRLTDRGVTLLTSCDTEVLLYWLIEHGVDGLDQLSGMFTLAMWDTVECRLLIARDRLGIKPLYMTSLGGCLLFASEIKALLPWLTKVKPNANAILQYVSLQLIVDDQTFFDGVTKFPAGSWMSWTADGTSSGRFWDVPSGMEKPCSFKAAVEEYSETLQGAVSRHLVADVPVGSYLSSGLDSSSILLTAAKQAPSPLHSFTGAFTEANDYYDERVGARDAALSAGSVHHEHIISPTDYAADIEDVIWHLEEPAVGSGALPHYQVARKASQNVPVVLTGHGGDELFTGYQVNKAIHIRDSLRHNFAGAMGQLLRVRRDEWSRILYFLLFPLLYREVRHGLFVMTPSRRRSSVLNQAFLDDAAGVDPFEAIDRLIADHRCSGAENLLLLYLKLYLPSLLMQEDKMGMAHSLEARMPLCDNAMIDLSARLPMSVKLSGGRLKAVPRQAVSAMVPPSLLSMPKRGFPTPFAQWYRTEPLKSFLADILLSRQCLERGVFNPSFVRGLLQTHWAGRGDTLADYARAHKIYAMSMVELWFREFADRDPLANRTKSLHIGIYSRTLG